MKIAAALIWPLLSFVFAGVFAGLWRAERARVHLLGFFAGFLTLALAMTVYVAFPVLNTATNLTAIHGIACFSVIAIGWGATRRVSQRIPWGTMSAITVLSCVLFYFSLQADELPIALVVQNGSSGLLFGMAAMALWMARTTDILDRILLWTLGLLAGFSLLRPLTMLFLNVEISTDNSTRERSQRAQSRCAYAPYGGLGHCLDRDSNQRRYRNSQCREAVRSNLRFFGQRNVRTHIRTGIGNRPSPRSACFLGCI